jgi:hypothetical protein
MRYKGMLSIWYKLPKEDVWVDDDLTRTIPKYSNGFGILGFSGQIIDDFYIVKYYADANTHKQLNMKEDITSLSDNEVCDILNALFDRDQTINEWNKCFKIGNY